jgi:hypothetical protein
MKKALIIVVIVILTILAAQLSLLGSSRYQQAPGTFVNIYKIEDSIAAGLKQQVGRNIYAAGNIEYRDSAGDLEFQGGAIYLLPHKVLFFRLYGGTGLQVSREEGLQYPFVVLGTDFLFFFSEVIHPLSSGMAPKFRGGFSFHF